MGVYRDLTLLQVAICADFKAGAGWNAALQDRKRPTNFVNFPLPPFLQFAALEVGASRTAGRSKARSSHQEVRFMRTKDTRNRRSKVAEEEHVLRLWALLHELVRGNGRVGAAGILGLDPRTVASCMDAGRMSWRVREALERAQREGVGSDAASTQSGVQSLKTRVEKLERRVCDVAVEVQREINPLVMDHARMLRQLEGRQSATGDSETRGRGRDGRHSRQ